MEFWVITRYSFRQFLEPERALAEMITNDIGVDSLGIAARREGGEVVYTVPIAVYVGRKPG